MKKTLLLFLLPAALSASNLITNSGRLFRDYKVIEALPSGLAIQHVHGQDVIPYSELPRNLRARYEKNFSESAEGQNTDNVEDEADAALIRAAEQWYFPSGSQKVQSIENEEEEDDDSSGSGFSLKSPEEGLVFLRGDNSSGLGCRMIFHGNPCIMISAETILKCGTGLCVLDIRGKQLKLKPAVLMAKKHNLAFIAIDIQDFSGKFKNSCFRMHPDAASLPRNSKTVNFVPHDENGASSASGKITSTGPDRIKAGTVPSPDAQGTPLLSAASSEIIGVVCTDMPVSEFQQVMTEKRSQSRKQTAFYQRLDRLNRKDYEIVPLSWVRQDSKLLAMLLKLKKDVQYAMTSPSETQEPEDAVFNLCKPVFPELVASLTYRWKTPWSRQLCQHVPVWIYRTLTGCRYTGHLADMEFDKTVPVSSLEHVSNKYYTTQESDCPACKGKGKTAHEIQKLKGLAGKYVKTTGMVTTCPACSGTGKRQANSLAGTRSGYRVPEISGPAFKSRSFRIRFCSTAL